jgi:hypothetical protein
MQDGQQGPSTPRCVSTARRTAASTASSPAAAMGDLSGPVGIANSAPLPMLSGQRCMIDFCLV